MKRVIKRKFLFVFGLLFIYIFPLIDALIIVFLGRIAFWHDPARDFLLALQKPTFIGPPSGISGIFYGPYWIWIISIVQIISKDPRIITFTIFTIPYFTLFPFLLFKFKKILGTVPLILIWTLFVFNYIFDYSTQPWNIHLTPIILLLIIYRIIFSNYIENKKIKYLSILIDGFLVGILINFNIAFGTGVLLGISLFILYYYLLRQKSKKILPIIYVYFIFLTGIAFSFLPFLIFEIRHNFSQTKTIISVVLSSSSAVGYRGFGKQMIVEYFLGIANKPFMVRGILGNLPGLFILGSIFYLFKKKLFNDNEKKLSTFLLFLSAGLLSLYLYSKNPVWNYHFIGVEIIILLLLGLIVKHFKILRGLLSVYVVFVILINIVSFATFLKSAINEPYIIISLQTKIHVLDLIKKDAKENYSVFVYDPAIYTYDYDYLSKWYLKKNVLKNREDASGKASYLIIPKTSNAVRQDFINNKTPPEKYITDKTWNIPEGTQIIKRVKID